MFDSLPECSRRPARNRGRAFSVAIALHVAAAVILGATSLLAVEPVPGPDGPRLVIGRLHVPPPRGDDLPPAATPAPAAATPTPAPRATPPPSTSAPRQPIVVPDTTPEPLVSDGPPSAGPAGPPGERSGRGPGVRDGVVGAPPLLEPPPLAPAPAPVAPIRVHGGIDPPVLLHQEMPIYPPLMRTIGIEAVVICEAIIDTSGKVVDVRVLRGHEGFHEATLRAMYRWRYRPATRDGEPVSVYFTLTVNYTLDR